LQKENKTLSKNVFDLWNLKELIREMNFEKIYCSCGIETFAVWVDEKKKILSLTCTNCKEEQQIEF